MWTTNKNQDSDRIRVHYRRKGLGNVGKKYLKKQELTGLLIRAINWTDHLPWVIALFGGYEYTCTIWRHLAIFFFIFLAFQAVNKVPNLSHFAQVLQFFVLGVLLFKKFLSPRQTGMIDHFFRWIWKAFYFIFLFYFLQISNCCF